MNKVTLRLHALWQTLTDVPGWPDAPVGMRIRRAVPVVVPIVSVLLVGVWHFAVTLTRLRSERASYADVVQLERELATLGAVCSEEEAAGLAVQGAAAQKRLLNSPTDASRVISEVTALAKAQGWDAALQALPVDPQAAENQGTLFFPVWLKGRWVPQAGNAEPFASLLAVTERVSALETRIELTRLAVRADDEGRQTVEVQLRLACRTQP